MCGFAGFLAKDNKKGFIDLNLLKHRGPDDSHSFRDDFFFGGHVRLSILELSDAGKQPMESADKRYILLFNGEIYNHLDLRRKLNQLSFKGHADTETLLQLLIHYGVSVLPELNGIFSFLFYDKEERSLLLCRDPFGVKPLYYASGKSGNIYFSSEIKPLFSTSDVLPELNRDCLAEFFMFHYVAGEQTLFSNVFELGPGTYRLISPEKDISQKYYEVVPESHEILNECKEEDILEQLEPLYVNAVRRQLLADVPLGIMLSGGLDSASVAAFSNLTGKSRRGYCFTHQLLDDEYAAAQEIASLYNVKLCPVTVTEPELAQLFEDLTWYYDEPIARPHSLAAYQIAKQAAKDQLKVLLTGEGGDEVFGGYSRYWEFAQKPADEMQWQALKFANNRVALPAMNLFLSNTEIKNSFREQTAKSLVWHDPINRQLFYDQKTFLTHFLQRSDRTGMACGLENRVPLLDLELTYFLNRIPGSLKIKDGNFKYLQRQVLAKYFSPQIINRKKLAFEMPVEAYMKKGKFSEYFKDTLSDRSGSALLFGRENLKSVMENLDLNDNGWKMCWLLLAFEIWLKKFNIST